MRTESEIQADIDSISADVANLQTVAPPLSGVNLTLQQKTNSLVDALKELLSAKSGPVTAGASDAGWKKKK